MENLEGRKTHLRSVMALPSESVASRPVKRNFVSSILEACRYDLKVFCVCRHEKDRAKGRDLVKRT